MMYIIIHDSLFDAQMRGQLKGSNARNGFYMQDAESTIRKVEFSDGDKTYYILSWEQDKPTSVLARYRESGTNERVNKIFTQSEIRQYLKDNILSDII